MHELTPLQKQANEFRIVGNYRQACIIYGKLWNDTSQDAGDWDGWGFAFCLLKLKKYADALTICKQVRRRFPEFNGIRGVYAWSIYHTELKNPEINDEERFLSAADMITKITTQDDTFSPYTHTVLHVLHYLSERKPYPSEMIINWTDRLNPEALSIEPFKFKSATGKQREHSSQREKYYLYRTKALNLLHKHDECIDACIKALQEITNYHDGNKFWILRQEAIALRTKGMLQEAVIRYLEILRDKKDWYVLKDLAEIHMTWEIWDEALHYAVSAAMATGDGDRKAIVYDLISNILQKLDKQSLSDKHMALAYMIRTRNRWNIIPEVQKKFAPIISSFPPEKSLYSELRNYWESILYGSSSRMKGKIINILANGKSGFIETSDEKTYYFSFLNVQARKYEIQAGKTVSFNLEDSFDKKKKEPSVVAVNVRLG